MDVIKVTNHLVNQKGNCPGGTVLITEPFKSRFFSGSQQNGNPGSPEGQEGLVMLLPA